MSGLRLRGHYIGRGACGARLRARLLDKVSAVLEAEDRNKVGASGFCSFLRVRFGLTVSV